MHALYEPRLLWAVILVLCAIVVLRLLSVWSTRLRVAVTVWLRTRRAQRGERDAEGLLRRSGFHVVDRQVPQAWSMRVDGMTIDVQLRADLLVRRGDNLYVAEVKTGRSAPRIRNPATRRQLLEYRLAYDVDGVLLVDMESCTVREVEFALGDQNQAGHGRPLALAVAVGIGALFATIVFWQVG